MEDIILIAILAVLVGGSAFGAIFAFVFFVWLFDRSRYEYDPNYKPKTAAELAREGEESSRSWARVNWLPKDLREALLARPGTWDTARDSELNPVIKDEMQQLDTKYDAGDPELCARAERGRQALGHWLRMTPEEVREHFEREWERYCEEYEGGQCRHRRSAH